MKPTSLCLTVYTQMKASHCLPGFETPHFHLWKVAAEFQTKLPIAKDRLIDLVYLEAALRNILAPVENTFLNQTFDFSPTSENLAQWLWDQISKQVKDAPLKSVTVTLCNLAGDASGAAKVERD